MAEKWLMKITPGSYIRSACSYTRPARTRSPTDS